MRGGFPLFLSLLSLSALPIFIYLFFSKRGGLLLSFYTFIFFCGVPKKKKKKKDNTVEKRKIEGKTMLTTLQGLCDGELSRGITATRTTLFYT